MADKKDLLQGTLDLLILRVLNGGPMHGFGIAQKIHVLSEDALRVEEGSLYPCLYRMEAKGWIKAEWGQSENNRKAKFYELTAKGRKQLGTEQDTWTRLAAAIGQVLRAAD
jgi:transcriptional regulator